MPVNAFMDGDGLDSLVRRLNLMRENYIPNIGNKLTAIYSRADALREKDKTNYVDEIYIFLGEVEAMLYEEKHNDCDSNPDLLATAGLRELVRRLRESVDGVFKRNSGNFEQIMAYANSMVTVGEMYRQRINQLEKQIQVHKPDFRTD